jgi:hypothetical protein
VIEGAEKVVLYRQDILPEEVVEKINSLTEQLKVTLKG